MRHNSLTLVLLVLALVGCQRQRPGAEDERPAPTETHLRVKLGTRQAVALVPSKPVSDKEAKRIQALIADLASIDRPDFGLSATLSGHSFSPVAGQTQTGALLLTDHKIEPSAALRTLVELGPRALPFLLSALEDRTPTGLKMEHKGHVGGMRLANELSGNPVSPREREVLSRRARPVDARSIKAYTVKVGDVCMVAIGQIVGRPYRCVRYQPTAIIVINSPTEDPELRAELRAIWSSKDPTGTLLDSLLTDYATEGVFNGTTLDGWYRGSELQCSAALRLLYYFPKETAPFIAARLRSFDVKTAGDLDGWMRREVRNGARTDEFIQAVKWCKDPAIQQALRDLQQRTDDQDILTALKP
jgi:hypothetical protein